MTYYGGADLARSFRTVRGNTIQVAEDIPEAQYDFRASADVRSVREMLAHVVVAAEGLYQAHAVRKITTYVGVDFPALMRERQEKEGQLDRISKADLIARLKADGERWGAFLDALTEDDLSVILAFPEPLVPRTKSRFEILLSAKEHEMHHRAQLMVYERLLGVVPHLTRQRAARMAAPPEKR